MFQAMKAALAESAAPIGAVVPAEKFGEEHRRLLTDKLSKKVAELEAALSESRNKEIPVAASKQVILSEEVPSDLPDFPFDGNRLMQVARQPGK